MENTLEIINDHYKDSVARQDIVLKKRDKIFYLILGIISLMLFKIFLSEELLTIVSQVSTSKLGLNKGLNIGFLNSIVWFVLLMLVTMYLQLRTNTERLYSYIHYLETELNKSFGGNTFTREGKFYLNQYPRVLQWAHFIYNVLFPSILICVISIKIGSEWTDSWQTKIFSYPALINTVFYLMIMISLALAYRFKNSKQKETI